MRCFVWWIALLCAAVAQGADPADPAEPSRRTPAQRGYHLLNTKAYLPPDFSEEIFNDLWQTWETSQREAARQATPEVRRDMILERYGLDRLPDRDDGSLLQYVRDGRGNLAMTCFACHGGQVAGRVIPGLPNAHFALESLTNDVRLLRLRRGQPLGRMELGLLYMPLGTTVGTTNAAMFGVILLAKRDPDLNLVADAPMPPLVHHDLDAPPWWHLKKKQMLYIDGLAAKTHRAIMQFLLVPQNGPEDFARWEDDFRDILAYIESIQPPAYPFPIDRPLAARGEPLFRRHCAECHGTYGDQPHYPERLVPIEEVATDRVRLDALQTEHRRSYARSWFAGHGAQRVRMEPVGYVAPPLDGLWATAPYFHNGAVPTLWHVLHPAQRPVVWRRTSRRGYDPLRVGLQVEVLNEVPAEARRSFRRQREYYDTRQFGHSAAGHTFPDALNADEKRALLEYLKTL